MLAQGLSVAMRQVTENTVFKGDNKDAVPLINTVYGERSDGVGI